MDMGSRINDTMPDFGIATGYICLLPLDLQRVYSDGIWFKESPTFYSLPLLLIQILTGSLLSRAFYFLLRPLRQPRIVCNILAGMMLGPSVPQFWRGGMRSDFYMGYKLFPVKQRLTGRTLAAFGIMFHMLLIGVKTDLRMVRNAGRRALTVGVCCVAIPFTLTALASIRYRNRIFQDSAVGREFLIFLPASLSTTAFPVLSDLLSEIRLLNSELGRLAMSAALVNDVFGWVFITSFTAVNQKQLTNAAAGAKGAAANACYALLSLTTLLFFISFGFRPWAQWVARNTPRGSPVRNGYVVLILVLAMITGLLSDAIGVSYIVGPLALGLAVPPGPPLGAAVVQRTETVVTEVLLPVVFIATGQLMNVRKVMLTTAPEQLVEYGAIILLYLLAFMGTIIGTMVAGAYSKIPTYQAFLLGLIMNMKGLVEIVTYFNFRYMKILDRENFTILMLSVVLTTGVAAPVVEILYKPFDSAAGRGWRTVQRLKPHEELRVVICVTAEDSVPSIISLLEVFSGAGRPLCAYVLHLVELVAAASSSIVSHKNKKGFINPSGMDPLLNAFATFEQYKHGAAAVFPFTALAPPKTMHHDACVLAVERNAALLLAPFPRKDLRAGGMSEADQLARSLAADVVANATCSVGLLVYSHGAIISPMPREQQKQLQKFHVGLLFWGGPDDREALAAAARMADHPAVYLSLTRFVWGNHGGGDEDRQRDDRVIGEFMIEHAGNERVSVVEVVVRDIEETFAAVRSIDRGYDLVMVGRRQPATSHLDEGLAEFSEWKELGIIGDMLASPDFDSPFSVLVMQQQ